MQFPLIDSIKQYVSPSFEVQERFHLKIIQRVKAAVPFSFGTVGAYSLMNPITFQAAVVCTGLTFLIGSIALLALTAYQYKNMPYDADAEARAQQISSDKEGQFYLLAAIRRIPQGLRDWLLSATSPFAANLKTDYDKYLFIQSLNMASTYLVEDIISNRTRLNNFLKVTPYAFSLLVLLEERVVNNILQCEGDFCEDAAIRTAIINELDKRNHLMSQVLEELAKIEDPVEKADFITRKSASNGPGVIECLMHYKFLESHLERLGLDKESPLFKDSHRLTSALVKEFNESMSYLQKNQIHLQSDEGMSDF